MELTYKIVYRYFLLFQDLSPLDRVRKAAYNNSYYGFGLCEFIKHYLGDDIEYVINTTSPASLENLMSMADGQSELWKKKL